MKISKWWWALLFGCLWFATASASPSFVEATPGAGGVCPCTAAFTHAPTAKDVFAGVLVGAGGGKTPGAITVSDSVYSTNWTQVGSTYYNSSNDQYVAWFIFQVPTTSGSDPTVTATTTNATYSWLTIFHFTGYAGTATADASAVLTANGAATTTMALSGIASSFANEVLLFGSVTNAGGCGSATGWTNVTGGADAGGFYAIEASPTSNNFSCTIASGNFVGMSIGIYDSAGASTHIQGGFALSPSN